MPARKPPTRGYQTGLLIETSRGYVVTRGREQVSDTGPSILDSLNLRASDTCSLFPRAFGARLQALVPSYGGGHDGESGCFMAWHLIKESTDGGNSFLRAIGVQHVNRESAAPRRQSHRVFNPHSQPKRCSRSTKLCKDR
jgi:hypothetical protein